jgi:predicted permease
MRWNWWRNRDQDLARELQTHLDLEEAEQMEAGLSRQEARYAARRALGNSALVMEDVRATWGWTWVESCMQDLRFGSRVLMKSPGVSLAVVVSLALGLGATTALFSLLNSLLFKALPVPEAERLVILQHGVGADLDTGFTYPQFDQLRPEARSAVELFAVSSSLNRLQAAGVDRKVEVQYASGDYFRILGIQPQLGRLLGPGDDVRGAAPVAVISHRLWQNSFGGDPSIAGRKVLIDAVPFTVAGVTPKGFFGVEVGGYPDVVLTFASKPVLSPQFQMLECRGCYWLTIMGRLRPSVDTATAAAGLNVAWKNVRRATVPETLAERWKAEYFADRLALARAATGRSPLRERFTKPLFVLLAMAGLILLIACSNVANLLTARALARRRELAVRLSIGARRGRLIRQLLTESALLGAAGLAASAAVYWFCVNSLLRFLQTGHTTYYLDTSPDPRLIGFSAGLAVLTLCLFGLAPGIRSTHWRLIGSLAESSPTLAARRSLSRFALGGQMALSLTLLLAAVLLARSLYDLRTFDAGFRRDHLLLVSPDASAVLKDQARIQYMNAALAGIRQLPGVRSASASVVIPMSGSSWQREFAAASGAPVRGTDTRGYVNLVTPDFFRTMGTRLLMGRDLTERDSGASPKVAVVNQSFAQRYWGDENPLGRQFHEVDKKEMLTVVGVVEDAKYRDFRKAAPASVYLPLLQADGLLGWDPHVEVWTNGDPHVLIAPIRELLSAQQSEIAVTYQTFTELIDERLVYERLMAALSVAFGALGLLICAVGIYGVAAYSVNCRTAEIGIRMALGATPGGVMRLIFGEQVLVVVVGMAAGAAGALGLSRFLRAWLFGVSPTDVPSLVGSLACLGAIAALATAIPARRAAATEPLRVLRHQ